VHDCEPFPGEGCFQTDPDRTPFFSTPALYAAIVMSRVCQLTGKRANNGMAVSHSHVRTKKLQQVNLQERRLWWAEGNRFVRLRVSTKALRTIQKKGLGAYARELGVDLSRI
jgi:large subunit ribosomal protein L28